MPTAQIPCWPVANTITPFSTDGVGVQMAATLVPMCATIANSFSTANLVLYYPFRVCEVSLAQSMGYIVGGTQSGNVDLGIYREDLSLLVNTGSTAQGAANTYQNIDITDTPLWPGRYFMAITWSTTSGGAFMASSIPDETAFNLAPVYTETTGGFGLPSTATPVKHTATGIAYVVMGVHFNALV